MDWTCPIVMSSKLKTHGWNTSKCDVKMEGKPNSQVLNLYHVQM